MMHAGDTAKDTIFHNFNEIDNDDQFLDRVIFCDKFTFRISEHVHRHNIRTEAK